MDKLDEAKIVAALTIQRDVVQTYLDNAKEHLKAVLREISTLRQKESFEEMLGAEKKEALIAMEAFCTKTIQEIPTL